jgi:hypothetical protein
LKLLAEEVYGIGNKKVGLEEPEKRRTRIDVLSVYDGDEDKNMVHAVR